jgi:hypothetical protein
MTSRKTHRQRCGNAIWPRAVAVAATLVLQLAVVALAEDGAKSPPVPPAGDPRIEITSSATSWDNLSELFLGNTPAAPFGDGSVFVMRGELRNKSGQPVHHVVLRYELLDDKGKVIHDAEGFNRSAEAMRPDEEGAVHVDQVKPIPAGGVDSYRMVFFHDEVPHFTSQRVRVVEVHDQAPAAVQAPAVVQPPKATQPKDSQAK